LHATTVTILQVLHLCPFVLSADGLNFQNEISAMVCAARVFDAADSAEVCRDL